MISDSTSESGSVPMDLMRASHMKCHIWVRYSGPLTRAHSSSRGMDSAAATRTRQDRVKDANSLRCMNKTSEIVQHSTAKNIIYVNQEEWIKELLMYNAKMIKR